ncbi:hypothetical protein B0H14DRAFT_2590319 [Mycena olivaceomarginata]|nr:hypothetical protein B0H14DRAFT_2590319 [Mycena olivaceomarginata]
MGGLPESLEVPEAAEKLTLPRDDISVLKLIKFSLPPLHKATAFLNPTDYLSEYAPTVTEFGPRAIPVPPQHVVNSLVRTILTDLEIQSIVLTSGIHCVWRLWARMEREREAMAAWRTAVDCIHETIAKNTTSESAANAKHALELLDQLAWTGNVQGFKSGGSISNLALWFTTEWLNTDHEDTMLEILADDLYIRSSVLW